MRYVYGMRLRGYSLGCQPKKGFIERRDDPTGRYWDLLVYEEKLSQKDEHNYDLDFIGMED